MKHCVIEIITVYDPCSKKVPKIFSGQLRIVILFRKPVEIHISAFIFTEVAYVKDYSFFRLYLQ
jgi:hypothetical protein